MAYLEARGCAIPPRDGDLRYHSNCRHSNVYAGPALVALITCALTAAPMSLHYTWIQPEGHKADCVPARRLLGGHRKKGGVIRLWPNDAVTNGLGIAEGIETALSLAHAFRPVWALIDAGNLRAFPPFPGIEALTIAADNDQVGRNAASECAAAWSSYAEVRVIVAPGEGNDLNDTVRADEC